MLQKICFKTILIILFICSLFSCTSKKSVGSDYYRVIRIDTTKKDLYVIYFNGKIDGYDNIFRVLSNKNNDFCKEKITNNKKYRLSLDELTSVIKYQNNSPRALIFNDTEILLKDSIASSKIYITENIDGLCYKKN